MNTRRRKRLEEDGWSFGTVQDFLGLTDEEYELIKLRVRFGRELKEWRLKLGLSQADLAKRIRSSQSRVAKMETGDPSVSLDLYFRAFALTGYSFKKVGRAVAAVAA